MKKLKAGEISPAVSSAAPSTPTDNRPISPTRGSPNMSPRTSQPEKSSSGNSALGDLGIEFESAPPRGGSVASNRGDSLTRGASPLTQRGPTHNVTTRTPPPPRRSSVAYSNKPLANRETGERETIDHSPAPEEKIEPISFHSFNRRKDEHDQSQKQTKRKEINLFELRQALEESLSKKDLPTQAAASAPLSVGGLKKGIISDEGVVAPTINKLVDKPEVTQKPSSEELSPENIEAPPVKPRDELSIRIDEEKEMDKVMAEENSGVEVPLPQLVTDQEKLSAASSEVQASVAPKERESQKAKDDVPENKKNVIKPGETVKF